MSDDIKPVAWEYKNDYGTGRLTNVLSYRQVDNYYVGVDKKSIKGIPLYDQATVEALQAKVAELENDLAFFKEAVQAAVADRDHYRDKCAELEAECRRWKENESVQWQRALKAESLLKKLCNKTINEDAPTREDGEKDSDFETAIEKARGMI